MATFTIESNGRIEKTAVYYNGEQLGGVREILINLNEDGTFDAVIQYTGKDEKLYIKNIFLDNLDNLKIVPPSFTEEEAINLVQFSLDSDGDINDTAVFINEELLEGIVSVFIHIKSNKMKESGLKAIFGNKNDKINSDFKSEITFRNEDDTLQTERIF